MRSVPLVACVAVAIAMGCDGAPHFVDEDGAVRDEADSGPARVDASVPDGGTERAIALHVAAQNTWLLSQPSCGAVNDVISISGHWFLQQGTFGSDFAGFLARSQQDIEDRLGDYLAAHPEVTSDTDAILVMDIEEPHLRNLHTFSPADQDAIVTALEVRIAATRRVFPNARLGVYGTLVPDGTGEVGNATYLARLAALIEAGREGLYDELDYLVPVLYVRFGCDEVNGPCDSGWGTTAPYTQQGVEGSMQLRRSDDTSLPLLPLLSFRVHNGNSAFYRVPLLDLNVSDPLDSTLGVQLGILEANHVVDAVLWSGTPDELLGDPNPNARTITDYVCSASLQN
jgi:hypothetical protein